jgi:hypothetical protein
LFVASDPLVIFICINGSDRTIDVKLCRRRFPVRIAFAVMVSKAQGQTLESLAVYPPSRVSFPWPPLYGVFLIVFVRQGRCCLQKGFNKIQKLIDREHQILYFEKCCKVYSVLVKYSVVSTCELFAQVQQLYKKPNKYPSNTIYLCYREPETTSVV